MREIQRHLRGLAAIGGCLLVLCTSVAHAQQSTTVIQPMTVLPFSGYSPGIVNGVGFSDPYATVGTAPSMGWLGNLSVLPAPESLRDRVWYRLEYLRWWNDGMNIPTLATTSPPGTPQNQAAILGQPGTTTLFGPGHINEGGVSGIRSRAGMWFRQNRNVGLTSEFFRLNGQNDRFGAGSDGSQILGRPFFDVTTGAESAQLISYPALVSGNLAILSKTAVRSFMLAGRAGLCPPGTCAVGDTADRVDFLIGYRYLRLRDQLIFGQDINSLVPTAPLTAASQEMFYTKNRFNGFQLGMVYQANFRRAWIESLVRVAIGGNRQTVSIRGTTSITDPTGTTGHSGVLLTQRSNIGEYERSQFVMIPELGMTVGVRLRDWLHATIGYSVLYFPNVVRAGDQIDTDVNSNLLPPEATPFTGALRPRFQFDETQYWAHGINLGAQLTF